MKKLKVSHAFSTDYTIWQLVLRYLPFEDVHRCRRVSKLWHYIIEKYALGDISRFQINTLVINLCNSRSRLLVYALAAIYTAFLETEYVIEYIKAHVPPSAYLRIDSIPSYVKYGPECKSMSPYYFSYQNGTLFIDYGCGNFCFGPDNGCLEFCNKDVDFFLILSDAWIYWALNSALLSI